MFLQIYQKLSPQLAKQEIIGYLKVDLPACLKANFAFKVFDILPCFRVCARKMSGDPAVYCVI